MARVEIEEILDPIGIFDDPELPEETAQELASREASEAIEREKLKLARESFQFQKGIALSQEARSKELFGLFRKEFLPVAQKAAQEAAAGIPAEPAVARAVGTVQQQADIVAQEEERQLSSFGIDPSSPLAIGARSQRGLGLAASRAGAANQARANVRDVNFQRRGQIAELGLRIPATASGIASGGAAIFGQGSAGLQGALSSNQSSVQRRMDELARQRAAFEAEPSGVETAASIVGAFF